jgi:PAS domain S-box-containing protein
MKTRGRSTDAGQIDTTPFGAAEGSDLPSVALLVPEGDEAAEARDAFHRSLIEAISDLIAVIDTGRVIRYLSPAVEAVLGHRPEEVIGRSLWDFIHPEDAAALDARMMSRLRGEGDPARFTEIRAFHRDGSCRTLQVRARRLARGPYAPAIVVAARDITESKLTEQRYHDIVDGVDVVVWEKDLTTGRGTFISHAVERILGYPIAQWYEEPELWEQILHPDDRERALGANRRTIRERCGRATEYRVFAIDGRVVWVRDLTYVICDESGAPQQLRGVMLDITEQRQLEEQLHQARKMEAVGLLAGGVAHDFNNVLTGIKGYTELLMRTFAEDDPRRRDAEEIRKAADRAGSLTRQLMTFGRRQVLEPRLLDLGAVVAEMEAMLRHLIGEHIELRAAIAPALGAVRADRAQLEQVILNLALNARDAMPRGGALRIDADQVTLDGTGANVSPPLPPGSYVRLAISDTGCGIDEEMQRRIFEPFFTTKEPGKGTGLGLSTVYGIVEQSGGAVSVRSRVGVGSSFTVLLPRVEGGVRAGGAPPPAGEVRNGSETILLAEDAAAVRKLARRVLEMRGYRVLEAADGAEAELIAERFPDEIHLLLSDVVMPHRGGIELANLLARTRPTLRVLLMSGHTEEVLDPYRELGPVLEFVEKPFTPDTLTRKVREVLDTIPGRSGQREGIGATFA